jgi:5-methyltetrahydropteroyltriglutamate--homocysteine methyltransferase
MKGKEMVRTANLGFPRLGAHRELKRALEGFWSGKLSAEQLEDQARGLRREHWLRQRQAGIDSIPSNDFSLYDQVLDMSVLVGAIPQRYGWSGGSVELSTYFAMARGGHASNGDDLSAMEMTKWFDTNYHYLVPEIEPNQQFVAASTKPVDEFREAKALGILTRPVLLGPVSFLLLAKSTVAGHNPLETLPRLLSIYAGILEQLAQAGAEWVQLDEPCLVLDLDSQAQTAYREAYKALHAAVPQLQLLLTTYFGDLRENLSLALGLPVQGIHLDLVRAPQQLDPALASIPEGMLLSLGLIDGRTIWRSDLDACVARAALAIERLGHERIELAPSCSLLHVPIDVALEQQMDAELRSWLAFAQQKLAELYVLKRACCEGVEPVADLLHAQRSLLAARRSSPRVTNPAVQARLQALTPAMAQRTRTFEERKQIQAERLGLPLLPSTTIGSFPQTKEVRRMRADMRAGRISNEHYEAFLRDEIAAAVRIQEEIGLDVLVHGESERTDMVEHFGQLLNGIAFSEHGWVQSYGSRAVRPPIIYGDVSRSAPMTVDWSAYAQSLTDKPMKGMLTGPITILQWSFVRNDLGRDLVSRQIALALRDEVADLETAGIKIIQIDEPALREGLPLRRSEWDSYLDWAVECFRLAASCVRDETQIHTHMCYAEFNDIIQAIIDMDADVISIESSRSKMELLTSFQAHHYPNEIGPGVYDIHSPLVPDSADMSALLREALKVFAPEQLWVNPDCGLKTRRWEEVIPALKQMVQAAQEVRQDYPH